MPDYFINDKTMELLSNNAKRFTQKNDKMNAAEVLEMMSRINGSIKTDGKYSVEAINYDGTVLKSGSYDTGEVFAMPKDANGNDLLEFDSWVSTAPITNNYCVVDDSDILVGALMKPIDDAFIIIIETTEENTEFHICLQLSEGDTIYWGDGTYDTNDYHNWFHHTYENIGTYIIKIYNTLGNRRLEHVIVGNIFGTYDNMPKLVKHIFIPSWIGKMLLYRTFNNMVNLQTITFAEGVSFNTSSNVPSYESFVNCSSLKHLILPSSVTILPEAIFGGYHNTGGFDVEQIILPYGVTEIQNGCFAFSSISNITIPDSVTSIGNKAFEGCANLSELMIPKNVKYIGAFFIVNCNNLNKIIIDEGITEINDYVFSNDSIYGSDTDDTLQTIILPSTVESIGSYAFDRRSHLISLVLKSSIVCEINDMTFKSSRYSNWDLLSSGRCSVYVPDNLVNSYKATNIWSQYASNIKPLSQFKG